MIRLLWFLAETIGSLLVSACLMRALAWHARLGPHDPVSRFSAAATDWIVRPLRRLVPLTSGTDWSSVLAAALIAGGAATLALLPTHGPGALWLTLPSLALFWFLKWALYLLMGLVLLQAVMSWVNPSAPIAPTVRRMTLPFLSPLQRVLPTPGGVDLSPLAVLLLAQLAIALLEFLFFPSGGRF